MDTCYTEKDKTRLFQGDLIESFNFERVFIKNNEIVNQEITEPFVFILTQDCDLQWDYEFREKYLKKEVELTDKFIDSIILVPAYLVDKVKQGLHLENIGYQMMNTWSSDGWKSVLHNKNERYHYVAGNELLGIPDLIIDFKRHFTYPREDMYKLLKEDNNFKAQICVPYRELLSNRFANFISRIAVPEIKTK